MPILLKSTRKGIGELKKTDTKYRISEKLTHKKRYILPEHPSPPPPPPANVLSSVEEIVLWFSYEEKFRILQKLASVISWS